MSTLTGQQIDQSYLGLIKTNDNAALSATAKAIQDGSGGATNLEMSNTATNFVSGTVDFTGSTVSGLPTGVNTTYDLDAVQSGANVELDLNGSDATQTTVTLTAGTNITLTNDANNNVTIDAAGGGAAGLVTGGQTDSMKSAAALTTTAAVTLHEGDIVIGNGAASTVTAGTDLYNEGKAIVVGNGAVVNKGVDFNFADTKGGIAIGTNAATVAHVNDGGGLAIGQDANCAGAAGIAIGNESLCPNDTSVAIGYRADAAGGTSIAIGKNADTSAGWAIAIGETANVTGGGFRTGGIAIGANVGVSALDGVAIGNESDATAAGAVALGHNVQATIAETTSVSALEVQTDSTPTAGGIIMSDAGGTDRRLNITSDGTLQVDSAPAAGQVFKLPRVGGLVQSSGCDVIQSSVLIPANTFQAGDMWQLNGADSATGSTGFVYSAFWISTTGTIGGSATEEMNLGQQESGNAAWSRGYQKTIYVGTQDGTGIGSEVVCSGCPSDVDGNNNAGMITYTPDWTSDLYLVTRICVDNAGATYVNHGATLRKIN